ncbi:MAG TPA: Crp/Fnr family transcriptional regulator [Spongiibacteraceae bacterium]|nr:Crp/Fnr family transcriptional regulator [Spongiibacteraceae bacterium]
MNDTLRPTNNLLATLLYEDRKLVLDCCEEVQLIFSDTLCEQGKPVKHAYFPLDSFASLAMSVPGHASIEIGLVGNEGMLGFQLILGVATSPLQAQVQGAGVALRIEAKQLEHVLQQSQTLQYGLNRYVYVFMCQLTQTAVCSRLHKIEARLARWLLITQDRAHSHQFHLTHEFLAYMLGVRRAGVSTAAGLLQQQKLIRYRRGDITILDRHGLEAVACSCYATVKKLYEETLNPNPEKTPQ